jgi:hypothetical protein
MMSRRPDDEWRAVRDRLTAARKNLECVVENVLGDLGTLGRAKGREILGEVLDELDAVESLLGDPDDQEA